MKCGGENDDTKGEKKSGKKEKRTKKGEAHCGVH